MTASEKIRLIKKRAELEIALKKLAKEIDLPKERIDELREIIFLKIEKR